MDDDKKTREQLLEELRSMRRVIEQSQRELQLANTIQASLFPIRLPEVKGATLAATAVSANEVGGDYCDLLINKNNRLAITIGDVMGKGVPAALLVAMTYAFVRNYAFDIDSPAQIANRLNRSLFPQLDFAQQFLTFFYCTYNPDNRELIYSNAGHNPPLLYRAAIKECEALPVRDFFIGGRVDAEYREGRTVLNPGDIVLFYTDGIKEGKNKQKEQFGLERIINLLKDNHIYDPASIQEMISCAFVEFLGEEPQSDDVTMIVIKIEQQMLNN